MSQEKTPRGPPIINAQKEELVRFMYEHHLSLVGTFEGTQGKIIKNGVWIELQNKLQSIPGGAQKTLKQWQSVRHISFCFINCL